VSSTPRQDVVQPGAHPVGQPGAHHVVQPGAHHVVVVQEDLKSLGYTHL